MGELYNRQQAEVAFSAFEVPECFSGHNNFRGKMLDSSNDE
jgi:hypothetical protein